jgi:hypothetical protein
MKLRLVAVVGLAVALVGCGSKSSGQAGGPAFDAPPPAVAPSSIAAPSSPGSSSAVSDLPAPSIAPSVLASPAPAMAATASSPFPAGSELALSSAGMGSDVSLVYAQNGVEVIGVASGCCGSEGGQPSTLWLSTDMTHWRDVTPPGSREQVNPSYFPGLYAMFDEASFLNASTGWVTTWNWGNLGVTAYRTSNGGKTWSSVAISGHGDHGGDADWIQLLTPTVAFDENVAATAPHFSLAMTTDAGQSWRDVYQWPSPTNDSAPPPVPFEMPVFFVSANRGFAAAGIPPTEGNVTGDFFTTNDGGVHWSRLTPPSTKNALCPTAESDPMTVLCLVSLPRFVDPNSGVLATEVISGAQATVGFDTTSDGGTSWRAAASADVPVPAFPPNGFSMTNYAFVATPSMTTWWITSYSPLGVITRVTSDEGSHWSTVTSRQFDGTPTNLTAVDATHALLSTLVIGADGATNRVYSTSDAGRSWQPLFAN